MINELNISYPDFKLLEIIDPDKFDTNNTEMVAKINEIKTVVNQITDSVTDGASGADIVSLTTIAPFTSAKLQTFLEEVVTRLKSSTTGTAGSELIGSSAITGVTGTTVKAQLTSLKGLLDALTTRMTTAESDIDKVEVRATNLETRATNLESRATSVEGRASTLESGKADKSTTYTKTETDTKLGLKTDKSGNHEGTWQGLIPTDFDTGQAALNLDNHIKATDPHGSYANAIAWAKGFGLGSIAKDCTSTDINLLGDTGFYRGSSITNAPASSGFIIHINGQYGTKVQYFSTSGKPPAIHVRYGDSTNWSSWSQLETTLGAQARATAVQDWAKGYGLGTSGKSFTGDLDTLTENGFYYASAGANRPTTSNCHVLVNSASATYVSQIAIPLGSNTMYIRVNNGGTWGAWTLLATQDWVKSFGLGTVAKTVTGDLNSILPESGLYMGNGLTNAPTPTGWYFIENYRHNATYGTQIAYEFTNSSITNVYTRNQVNGVWTGWARGINSNSSEQKIAGNLGLSKGSDYTAFFLERIIGAVTKKVVIDTETGSGAPRILNLDVTAGTTKSGIAVRDDGLYEMKNTTGAWYKTVVLSPNGQIGANNTHVKATSSQLPISVRVDKKLTFTAKDADIHSEFDVANGRFTAKEAGRYLFISTLEFTNASLGYHQMRLYKNGGTTPSVYVSTGNDSKFGSRGTVVSVAAGDYFDFYAFYDGTAATNVYGIIEIIKVS